MHQNCMRRTIGNKVHSNNIFVVRFRGWKDLKEILVLNNVNILLTPDVPL